MAQMAKSGTRMDTDSEERGDKIKAKRYLAHSFSFFGESIIMVTGPSLKILTSILA